VYDDLCHSIGAHQIQHVTTEILMHLSGNPTSTVLHASGRFGRSIALVVERRGFRRVPILLGSRSRSAGELQRAPDCGEVEL
jgi:hypothetical protein